jgi:hypothetical protein
MPLAGMLAQRRVPRWREGRVPAPARAVLYESHVPQAFAVANAVRSDVEVPTSSVR